MAVARTVGGVIDEARDLHGAFGKLDNPDVTCRRFVARYQRELAAKIYAVAPSYFGQGHATDLADLETLAIPATQAAFDAGIRITPVSPAPELMFAREVYAQRTDDPSQRGQDRVEIIPRTQRGGINNRFPWCWVDGSYLFPGGVVEDWVAYTGIKVRLITIPGVVADADLIALRDDAGDVILAALAAFMAARLVGLPGRPAVDAAFYAEQAAVKEAEYLALVGTGTTSTVQRIQEVV